MCALTTTEDKNWKKRATEQVPCETRQWNLLIADPLLNVFVCVRIKKPVIVANEQNIPDNITHNDRDVKAIWPPVHLQMGFKCRQSQLFRYSLYRLVANVPYRATDKQIYRVNYKQNWKTQKNPQTFIAAAVGVYF